MQVCTGSLDMEVLDRSFVQMQLSSCGGANCLCSIGTLDNNAAAWAVAADAEISIPKQTCPS